MKVSTEQAIRYACEARGGAKPHKWDEIFESESELIRFLMDTRIRSGGTGTKNGYDFLKSFQSFYGRTGFLTKKQMNQLKRLSMPLIREAYCERSAV